MAPHSRHANTTGTIRRLGFVRIAAGGQESEFGRPTLDQNSDLPVRKIDVRQGIARRRGHVAPARLLC